MQAAKLLTEEGTRLLIAAFTELERELKHALEHVLEHIMGTFKHRARLPAEPAEKAEPPRPRSMSLYVERDGTLLCPLCRTTYIRERKPLTFRCENGHAFALEVVAEKGRVVVRIPMAEDD